MFDPKMLTAADVMTKDVLTLNADASIREAIGLLGDEGVSGAPVVNDAGECIGVFSLADLARRAAEIEEAEAPHAAGYFNFDPLGDEGVNLAKDDYDIDGFEREVVGEWMTREIETVRPEASVESLCRLMLREGIHRVLVMSGKKLLGIVASLDIVALVAGMDVPRWAAVPKTRPQARRTMPRRASARKNRPTPRASRRGMNS
jgi:CBS domain-containing protein